MATVADLADPAALARLRAAVGSDPAPDPTPDETPGGDADEAPVEQKSTGGDAPEGMEHKSVPAGTQVLSADEQTGVVEALVSVTGVEDRVKDVIEPGAYTKTMAAREPIGVWSHDDKTWVARKEEAVELMPGDPFFKGLKLQNGEPWPAEAGAVKVKARFNLDTPHGKAAFSDVKFFQDVTSWSIGYRATKSARNPRTGVRHIKELDWFEFSPVMVGAAAQAMTLSVKSLAQPVDADDPTGIAPAAAVDSLDVDELDRYLELKGDLESVAAGDLGDLETKGLETKAGVRRVRTEAGARRFDAPIGSLIVRDANGGIRVLSTGSGSGKPAASTQVSGSTRPTTALGGDVQQAQLDRTEAYRAESRARDARATPGGGKPAVPLGGDALADFERRRDAYRQESAQRDARATPSPGINATKPKVSLGGDAFDDRQERLGRAAAAIEDERASAAMNNRSDEQVAKDDYVRLRVEAQFANYAEAGKLEKEAAKLARDEGLDEMELESAVLDGVFAAMSNGELEAALRDPSRRTRARAELARRAAEVKSLLDLDDDLGDDDLEEKASRASLDRSPRSNWVEEAGGLPPYIREVARAIERDDPTKDLEDAIPIAIGRIKKWARGGGDVSAETRAKAVAAIAAWEALKAKSGKKFDSDLLLELKAMPSFIKDKIAARGDGDDDKDDPKRKPHKFVPPRGGGGLCKKCMAAKGAKVHTNTENDEKALALLASYKTLGDVLARAGVLPGADEFVRFHVDDVVEEKGLTLAELERADDLRAAVELDEVAELFARRDALESKAATAKPEGYATVKERVAAARGFDEGLAKGKGSGDGGSGGGAKKGRKVRTEAGSSRYGVPIGEFYTKEKGEGPVKRGESGPRTKAAQKALVAAGLLDPKDGTDGDAEDGFLGPKTEAALKAWQKANGLEETGVLDEETERMLVKAKLRPDSDDGGVPAAAKDLPKHNGGVLVENASDEQVDALRAAGWKGKPGDGKEAMYPPAKAAGAAPKPRKAAAPKAAAGGDVAAIRAKLAAMPEAEREQLRARAQQVVDALAAL